MKLSTKTLASLMKETAKTVKHSSKRKTNRHFSPRIERLLQRHDRKGELRSSVLGIPFIEFKTLERRQTPEVALKSRGFAAVADYYQALLGKMVVELRQRGWSERRITTMMAS